MLVKETCITSKCFKSHHVLCRKLTMCGSWEASSLFPLSRCRTSVDHCSLLNKTVFHIFLKMLIRIIVRLILISKISLVTAQCTQCMQEQLITHLPMRSANPPTGSLQVPVTNCNNRILFSLSTSFTSYR